MDHGYEYVLVSFCKLLNAPADCMVEKTLEYDFQTKLHSITGLCTKKWLDVSEIKKARPKKFLKMENADFSFFQFSFEATLSHWYQD